MELEQIEGATHWIIHAQPALVGSICRIFWRPHRSHFRSFCTRIYWSKGLIGT
jgi:hypothetical protein